MTRPLKRSSTGSSAPPRASLRQVVGLVLLLALPGAAGSPASAEAQALKLRALRFPPTSVVGPWVSYRVLTQNRSRPGREYTQRVAVVARENYLGSDGFWVELKTEGLPSGTRIERGFFVESSDHEGAPAGGAAPGAKEVRLVRYQVYTSGGKLYEYPVGAGVETRAGADVSTLELFEYDPSVPPVVEQLGQDTLRIGRRVVPSLVERVRRYGADEWAVPNDTAHVQRPVLTQTYWKNPAVPITGFARSVFEVTTERWAVSTTVLAPADSAGPAITRLDSAATAAGQPPIAVRAPSPVLSRTELILLQLGADAVPEVTIAPEAAPSDQPEGPGGGIR